MLKRIFVRHEAADLGRASRRTKGVGIRYPELGGMRDEAGIDRDD